MLAGDCANASVQCWSGKSLYNSVWTIGATPLSPFSGSVYGTCEPATACPTGCRPSTPCGGLRAASRTPPQTSTSPRLGAWRGPSLDPCSGSQARCCRSQSEGTAADGEPLGQFARGGWIAAKVTVRCRQRNALAGRLCGRRGWSAPRQDHALGAPSTGDFGPRASICCAVDPWRVPRTARWREQDPPTIYSWQTEDTRIAFCLEHWTSLCSKWMTT